MASRLRAAKRPGRVTVSAVPFGPAIGLPRGAPDSGSWAATVSDVVSVAFAAAVDLLISVALLGGPPRASLKEHGR